VSTVMVPASAGEALGMLESAAGFLAGLDAAGMPAAAIAECLRGLERADAVQAVARGRFLQAFDAKDGHLADGQRTTRAWLVHTLRVTRGQAAGYRAMQDLAPGAPVAAGRAARGARDHQVGGGAAGQVDPGDPRGVAGVGRGDPGRGGPGRRRAA
jgi:hypothetical protein